LIESYPTAIPDILVIEPKVFGDARGFFYESFNQKALDQALQANGLNLNFVQDTDTHEDWARAEWTFNPNTVV
jgi:dTDP-4-dehydrorhamnose 3,5-epimerase